ncbi:MAG: DUF4383 domain-containing protein [Chloroflexota bacterium]|nr:DUF4383 domain-containing protein [Chloroflexota bacterium]
MRLAQLWALIAGVTLVLVGILGFVPNPIVGAQAGALAPTDTLHNIVHLGTGLLALYISRQTGMALVNGVIGFGVLYVVIFVAVVASPNLFGLFSIPANIVLHVIHIALAVVSLGVGFMARNEAPALATR